MHDLINLNKFLTKSIGFEDIFNRFFELEDFNGGHPFYNIKRIKDDKYVLEMALAGYTKSDVKVEVTDGVLSIKGSYKQRCRRLCLQGYCKASIR